MYYITVKQPQQFHQMTLEELLFGGEDIKSHISSDPTSTHTYVLREIPQKYLNKLNVPHLIETLNYFNQTNEQLRSQPRKDLYREFHIPKKIGGLRKIDAPNVRLMGALRTLKEIFEQDFSAKYHTSAFAYVRNRCTIDAVKRHQSNESKWFGKYDLSNFFGSTTLDFVMEMLSRIFPFSEVVKVAEGKEALSTALELAFLDGGLPQGTPISPLITNLMMIPIDHCLCNTLLNFGGQKYVYTRYADDFLVSSQYGFDNKAIEDLIVETLSSFNAPFVLNREKTRYGSSAGRNWNLGVMLNKDNQITVGSKKKRQFQAMLSSYIMDKKNGVDWDLSDVQVLEGYRSYYKMVEGDTIDRIVSHIDQKFGTNVIEMIKTDLRA